MVAVTKKIPHPVSFTIRISNLDKNIKHIKSVFLWPCLQLWYLAIFTFLPFQNLNAAKLSKLKVVTTFTILHDMAKEVAGDNAEVVCLVKYGAEIHNYEPTPQDLVKIQNANLILWNGLNLEKWFEKFFASQKNVKQVIVTTGIKPLNILIGSYANAPNPHAWMTPPNGKIYIENIRNALSEIDPINKNNYFQNAANYLKKLEQLEQKILNLFRQIPSEAKWLATSEGAFTYLTNHYSFQELYLWPINADQQGSPKQIQKAVESIRKHKIAAIFSESTISDKPAKQVANEAPTLYGGKLYVDSLTVSGGEVPTYLLLLESNAITIAKSILNGLKWQRNSLKR